MIHRPPEVFEALAGTRAFDVSVGDRILFVFSHPDDEMAVAAFVRRLTRQGTPVRFCWVHSTPVREAESRAAMSRLGLGDEHLTFLDAADGKVLESIPNLQPALQGLIESFQPTRIVTQAFEQGHIDHDATNFMVDRCFDGPIYEVPFYHTYLTRIPRILRFADPVGEETIELSPEEQRLKRSLLRLYDSQSLRRKVMLYEILLRLTFRDAALFAKERMRLQGRIDYTRPNLPEPTASKVEASATWQHWLRAVNEML
ncbi:MAG: PIG-L family deacetylase [Armatimonadetes bacterium]|nr:PIG-L family deacetylase [Armatimonadota bacterium]